MATHTITPSNNGPLIMMAKVNTGCERLYGMSHAGTL